MIQMSNKYAIIENGKVINAVVAEADYAAEQGWIALVGEAGIGWDYTNDQFVDNRPIIEDAVTSIEPTREELLAQLNTLSAQIQSLT